MDYEVIIVGAGPAGIFAALSLAELGIESVLLLEQGKDLNQRSRKKAEDMLCGWGGGRRVQRRQVDAFPRSRRIPGGIH